ncbi:MAG: DUF1891 domain-containing protein [Limnobacter sp.]|nr:hypothetical protein [Sutterellaceae bacterium]MBA4313936.1 hypothetical protein [Alcaligenaceae bacterium]PZO11558.1 MAG: hypothetical protein DCE87_15955 [Betaproteobacteria bacterium]RZO92394.1 MAG: DUF1891 domain-containing protein [Limnobacter sp.]MBT83179.1 hypothetical protein [Sutterellaceae bacterium]
MSAWIASVYRKAKQRLYFAVF